MVSFWFLYFQFLLRWLFFSKWFPVLNYRILRTIHSLLSFISFISFHHLYSRSHFLLLFKTPIHNPPSIALNLIQHSHISLLLLLWILPASSCTLTLLWPTEYINAVLLHNFHLLHWVVLLAFHRLLSLS
jgi:hypothetical protein